MSSENAIAGYPRMLAPHLELRRVLGEGGSSIVFEAFHTRLKVPVAVKLLSVRGSLAEQARVRLMREAELYALLDDPRIPRVYDVDELPDGTPYVVMEFVPGGSLESLLEGGPLSPRRAVLIAREVLAALVYVHARGVLHRDVKPANVILYESDERCQVRLVDFGIAKVFADAPESAMTQQGTLVGTPHYMAPERLLGAESDEKSDVYSVGVMLYEMLSGRAPFTGPTVGEVIAAVLRDDPMPLRELCPHVAPALAAIVSRAMERESRDRYASAAEMLSALEHIESTLQGEVSSPRIIPPVRAPVVEPWTGVRSVPAGVRNVPAAALLGVEDDDLRPARRGSTSLWLPLSLAAGMGIAAWAAWPSATEERREPLGLGSADAVQTAEPVPSRGMAQPEAALAAPAEEAKAGSEDSRMLLEAPAQPAASAGEDSLLVPAPLEEAQELGPAHDEAVEPAAGAEADAAPTRAQARRAAHRAADTEAPPVTSGYEPVRAVPLQPLLEHLDEMLREPPAVPAATPSPAPASPPASAPLPPLPRRAAPRTAASQVLPDNPY